jgi:hypothetical protein
MEGPEWDTLVSDALGRPRTVVVAHTFVRAWSTASQPALVACDDGADWVVKGRNTQKQAVTDQILGSLGRALCAPVPEIGQVELPAALVAAQAELRHFSPGSAHGSRFEQGYTDRLGLDHAIPENAGRFTHLAGFYGWGMAQDHQFIYRVLPPSLVLSVDHGHFVGGPGWNTATLASMTDDADLDQQIEAHSPASSSDLEELLKHLDAVTDDVIASAVALPGLDWDITMEERTTLAGLLYRRRNHLRARLEERL